MRWTSASEVPKVSPLPGQLAERGMKLLLDFVPNHVAPDHPWITEHPEYFIRGNAEDARSDPASYIEVEGTVCAFKGIHCVPVRLSSGNRNESLARSLVTLPTVPFALSGSKRASLDRYVN